VADTPPRRWAVLAYGLGVALASSGCGDPGQHPAASQVGAGEAAPVRYVDVAADVGLTAPSVSGQDPEASILEVNAAGVAVIDYDVDGWQDLLFVNGSHLDADPAGSAHRMHRNVPGDDGDRRFAEVTVGIEDYGWGMGAAVGDIDADGDPDVYVTNWGPNRFYRNLGGHFTAETVGAEDGGWGTSAAFGDLDGDGVLDLYVANYLQLTADASRGRTCAYKGLASYCGPMGLPGQADRVYRGAVAGPFTDQSRTTGIDTVSYPALGVLIVDLDADGDVDVYVANDGEPNVAWRNDGAWRLREAAVDWNLAFSEDGECQAGMGVDAGDIDNDGDLDLMVTNFAEDVNTLYLAGGPGSFNDATYPRGLGGAVRPLLGWGITFLDADSDGWLDLFVANGHVYSALDDHPTGLRYRQPNLLFHNREGRFEEIGQQAGPAFTRAQASRSAARADFDNDGDPDLVVVNRNEPPNLLRNDLNGGRWLGLELVGSGDNRDAVGARVALVTTAGTQTRHVGRACSFQAQCDPRLLFGLGTAEPRRLEIRWPSGRRQAVADPPVGGYLRVTEGQPGHLTAAAPRGRLGGGQARSPRPVDLAPAAPVVAESAPPATAGAAGSTPSLVAEAARFYAQGRYDLARARLEQVLRREPDHALALHNLAILHYSGLGEIETAAGWFRRAVAADPQRADTRFLLGRALLHQGEVADAVPAFAEAVRLDPARWEHWQWLALGHLESGDAAAAVEVLEGALERTPRVAGLLLPLARGYEALGRARDARRARERFGALQPLARRVSTAERQLRADSSAISHLNLASLLAQQGRRPEAIRHFQRAAELAPGSAQAQHGLAMALHDDGRLQPAIQSYRRALDLGGERVPVLEDLARALAASGRFDEALGTIDEALELAPDEGSLHGTRGEIHTLSGHPGRALPDLEAAVRLDPSLVRFRDLLARCYAAQGRFAEAVQQWEAVLEVAPGQPKIQILLERARQRRDAPTHTEGTR
jgi:tetratricopeptide (TPR) repeat protein